MYLRPTEACDQQYCSSLIKATLVCSFNLVVLPGCLLPLGQFPFSADSRVIPMVIDCRDTIGHDAGDVMDNSRTTSSVPSLSVMESSMLTPEQEAQSLFSAT